MIARITEQMESYQQTLGSRGDEGIAIPGDIRQTKNGLRLRVKLVLLKISRVLREYSITQGSTPDERAA